MEKDKTTSTEQLKELLSKITKGEWRSNFPEIVTGLYPDPYQVVGVLLDKATTSKVEISYEEMQANMDLIISAKPLAKEVIELREESDLNNKRLLELVNANTEVAKLNVDLIEKNEKLSSENKVLEEALETAKKEMLEMGKIIRYLDEDNAYSERWYNDEGYIPNDEYAKIEAALNPTTKD